MKDFNYYLQLQVKKKGNFPAEYCEDTQGKQFQREVFVVLVVNTKLLAYIWDYLHFFDEIEFWGFLFYLFHLFILCSLEGL